MNETEADNYEIGDSTFYVVLETPPTTPQLPSSPVPPPRHRHNPFNKPDSPAMHQRSHSFRSHSGKV